MIYGERIRLRAIEHEDLPRFVRWVNDPEVKRTLLFHAPMSMAMEERWFARMLEAKDEFVHVAEVKDEGGAFTPIGTCGLHKIDWKNSKAELGISIGEKDRWGQGLGADIVRTTVRYAFDELGLHRVALETYAFNDRGKRCYEKVGFKIEGIAREALHRDGEFHDILQMGILRGELK